MAEEREEVIRGEGGQDLATKDQAVERLVIRLNTFCKTATFDFTTGVGELVIRFLYAGDLGRWRMRDPRKDHSLRRLVKHPHLPMSATALYHCIAVYELCERLGFRSWKHVCTSHVRLVLPLPPAEQARLLAAAEDASWSVRELDARVADALRSTSVAPARGGRRRRSRLQSVRRAVEVCVAALGNASDVEEKAENERPPLEGSPESVRATLDALGRLAEACTKLEARMQSLVPESAAATPVNVTPAKS